MKVRDTSGLVFTDTASNTVHAAKQKPENVSENLNTICMNHCVNIPSYKGNIPEQWCRTLVTDKVISYSLF